MAININAKTDYSYLFSGLRTGSGSAAPNLNFLSDYASIKNGSYGKLMKAYYGEAANDSVKSLAESNNKADKNDRLGALTKEEAKALTKVQSSTDELKESADALLEINMDTTDRDYDKDAVYSAVNQFVKDYNSVIDAAEVEVDSTVSGRVQSMMNNSVANEKMLNKIGITIGEDGKLAVDKDTFAKADMTKVKTMFQGNGSYGYRVSAQASLINFAADTAVNRAGTYTGNGAYNNAFNTGNIFNSYF